MTSLDQLPSGPGTVPLTGVPVRVGAGQLLAPWPDWIDGERYTFDGSEFQLTWACLAADRGAGARVGLWAGGGYRWLQGLTGDPSYFPAAVLLVRGHAAVVAQSAPAARSIHPIRRYPARLPWASAPAAWGFWSLGRRDPTLVRWRAALFRLCLLLSLQARGPPWRRELALARMA